ncbi:MAG: hypothetical protein AABO57_23645 [Acidobacteriota bacterium]
MTTSKYLVLWNSGDFADRLRKVFGRENVLTSTAEMAAAINQTGVAGVIVLGELNWDRHRPSDLYGIEYAKRSLRAEYKIRHPILFVSFLDLSEIVRDPKREIVVAVGHDFLRLPSYPAQWQEKIDNMLPLTDLQFTDVFNNLCNLRGLIDETIHRVQGVFRTLLSKPNPDSTTLSAMRDHLESGLKKIVSLLGDAKDAKSRGQEVIQRFEKEILDQEAFGDSLDFLSRIGEELKSLLPEAEGTGERADGETAAQPNTPWKVLLVDDEPDGLNLILGAFGRKGIDYVVAKSVNEAERIIEQDINNQIVVVVCDYRLYEVRGGILRQQSKQGYDLLFDLSRGDRFTRLIALSGLSRRFLLESFQKYHARVAIYSKNDLRSTGATNIFVDNILDTGSEVWEALCSQPEGGDWEHLRPFYVAHRESHDYASAEEKISQRALRYVSQIDSILSCSDPELLLNPSLPQLKDLQAKMVSKDPRNPRHLEVFRTKLVARRIALWLSFVKGFSAVRIYAALSGALDLAVPLGQISNELRRNGNPKEFDANSIESRSREKLENKAKTLINTNLALALSELPSGILVEEKRWFEHDIGISIYAVQELLSQIAYHIQVGLEYWLEENPNLVERLPGLGEIFGRTGHLTIGSFSNAKRTLLLINNAISGKDDRKRFGQLLHEIETVIRTDKYCVPYLEGFSKYTQRLVESNIS